MAQLVAQKTCFFVSFGPPEDGTVGGSEQHVCLRILGPRRESVAQKNKFFEILGSPEGRRHGQWLRKNVFFENVAASGCFSSLGPDFLGLENRFGC